jgi:putative flavoprotein involved in K+ transport
MGDDRNGFATMPEVIDFIAGYAGLIAAPVETRTRVTSVRRAEDRYVVATTRGTWLCRAVVLASGACNIASVPAFATAVPSSVSSLTPMQYRNPDALEPGGVVVVGASATGIQLADEIHRSERPVTLAVGEHIRAPRTYRGRDIQWWMDAAGVLNQRYDEIDDIMRARRVPSLQLVGSPDRGMIDLNALRAIGVQLTGVLSIATAARSAFPGRSAINAPCPISRWAGCSTPSITGRAPTASTRWSARRIALLRP